MTEQNLSLDEMIELANVFENKRKWKFGKDRTQQLRGQLLTNVLETEKIDGMYFVFLQDYGNQMKVKYSIHLLIDGKDSNDVIEVGNYFVETEIVATSLSSEEYEKVSKLYDSLKLSACAYIAEEQRQRDAEAFGRHEFVRQKKEQAIDTARKSIGR